MTQTQKYTVVLVEDDEKTLSLLKSTIAQHPQLTVTCACSSIEAAKIHINMSPPTVLLTDLGLPDGNGTDLIQHVYQTHPQVLTMVLSMFGDEKNVVNAIMSGAKGYILKQNDYQNISDSVLELIDGASPISAAIARYLLVKLQKPEKDPEASHHLLTKRETQVLELVAQGYKSGEIAEKLSVSYHTVVHHIRIIYDKLAVTSRSQAIYKATKIGLLKAF